MIAQIIVVADEVDELLFKIARQIIVFKQDAVLEDLVPSFNFALGQGMRGRTTGVIDTFAG